MSELAVEQSNALLPLPPILISQAPYGQLIWQTKAVNPQGEGLEVFGLGVIRPLAVLLANEIKMDRVGLWPRLEQRRGLKGKTAPRLLIKSLS